MVAGGPPADVVMAPVVEPVLGDTVARGISTVSTLPATADELAEASRVSCFNIHN